MTDARASVRAVAEQLLARHPDELPPAIWGELVEAGLFTLEEVARVYTATTGDWPRREIARSVGRLLDETRARELVALGCDDVQLLARVDDSRLERVLSERIAAGFVIPAELALLARVPHLAPAAIAKLDEDVNENLGPILAIVAAVPSAPIDAVLADFDARIDQGEATLLWDTWWNGECDPRETLAEIYDVLGRTDTASRWRARADALPYPWQPEVRIRTPIVRRPEPPAVDLQVATAIIRGVSAPQDWIAVLVAIAAQFGELCDRCVTAAWRVARDNPWHRALVLAAGHGSDADYEAFATLLEGWRVPAHLSHAAAVVAAAPSAIAKRMAKHLLASTFPDDFTGQHYRAEAILTMVDALADDAEAMWRELGLPIDTASLLVLPRAMAESEAARRAPTKYLAYEATIRDLAAAPSLRAAIWPSVFAAMRAARLDEPFALSNAVFPLYTVASVSELAAIADVLDEIGARDGWFTPVATPPPPPAAPPIAASRPQDLTHLVAAYGAEAALGILDALAPRIAPR